MIKDTKNWTWVLERRCGDCGFDASTLTTGQIGPRLVQACDEIADALARPGVSIRPSPDVWSPLEYGCHVRDVCRVFSNRLTLMLAEDDPAFENWDQDQTAVQARYGEQDPSDVAVGLRADARALAAQFVSVTDWDRTGLRSDGSRFTVRTLGQYLVHDPVHHVWDVTRPLP